MSVDYKDYYSVLGVDKSADQKTIRQAYRKLARQYHPDVNPGDKVAEERFKEINEANEVLADAEKRQKYDELSSYYQQYGRMPGEGAGFGGGAGFQPGGGQYRTMSPEEFDELFGGQSPFSDFFETFFAGQNGSQGAPGGRQRQQRAMPGADTEAAVDVTLSEVYTGVTRVFELAEANGDSRRLEVKIPAGVNDGARIRIAGQGLLGVAGRGDLYLRVHVLSDPRYTREGTTLRTRVDVPLTVAVLGGEVQVTVPDGRRLLLRIPAEVANGKAFRLRGQGLPQSGQPELRGDLYAEVNISMPTGLTEEQRQLFEAFAHSLE